MSQKLDLSQLNDRQRTIATTLDAPLFVEAGAGSGKTFTLTQRVAWALSPGSAPDVSPPVSGNRLTQTLSCREGLHLPTQVTRGKPVMEMAAMPRCAVLR